MKWDPWDLFIGILLVLILLLGMAVWQQAGERLRLESQVTSLEARPTPPVLRIEAQEIGLLACPEGSQIFTMTKGIVNGFWVGCH